jgi:hypothetical protein
MKQINGYWTDENNNRWDTEIYTEGQAEKFSKSLVDCHNCRNCSYCYNCNYCDNCQNCIDCRNCDNCHACRNCRNCHGCDYCDYCDSCYDCDYCHNCRNCYSCRNCINCRNCYSCDNCNYCNNCRNCHYCNYYKLNPQRYTTGKIGSRNDQTTFYYGETENNEKEIQVVCGCFFGNLEDFEKAVLETHKDNDLCRKQYLKEIEKVKVLFELEVA